MIDKYNREIDYLRISLTDKCNLNCVYCMPKKVDSNDHINDVLTFEDYKFIVKGFSKIGIKKVRFTGGEPLIYDKLENLIKYTKESCNIDDICITTNAIGLYEKIEKLKENGLKKVNISIDSLDEDKYKKITRGGNLKEVLKAVDKCIDIGIKVKINCVLIKGLNDDELNDFINLTIHKNVDVRFIELMPLGEGLKMFEKGYINLKEALNKIEKLKPVNNEEKSVASYYKIEGSKGKVGIITPMSCSFCSECNRIRMTSNGKIKLCLHSNEELDITKYLNNEDKFCSVIQNYIYEKPEKHNLIERKKSDTHRNMNQIGG
ncbi:GTP 3',8-cyclase MoaA [Paraclostridium ghonii]|uniref:GTP 3',8-cyclase MoaA n=1 Tax=Paraclostridium ghonii TaxID=29358 RepID=UPI00202CFCE2|nr:GTP 3',8-cyclase MoaA [Paeniclostridium ghonii]MCM0167836.1 GTP 3',8-cyclase MoaA [Paeniclostridium ghonii]